MGFLGDFSLVFKVWDHSLYVFQEIIRIHAIKWSDHAPFKNQGLSHKLSICRFVLAGLPLDAVVAYLRKGYPVFCLGWHCDTTAIRFTNWMRFHELWPYFTDDLGAFFQQLSGEGRAHPHELRVFLPMDFTEGGSSRWWGELGLAGVFVCQRAVFFFSFFWVGVSQLKKYIYLKKTSMFIHLCI